VQTFNPLSFDQGKHRLCLAGIVVDLDRVRADKVCCGYAFCVFDGLKKGRIIRRNVAEAMRFSTGAAGLTQVMQSELHDREVCRSCEGIKLCSEVFRGDRSTNCNIARGDGLKTSWIGRLEPTPSFLPSEHAKQFHDDAIPPLKGGHLDFG